jgi:hypothetical protein
MCYECFVIKNKIYDILTSKLHEEWVEIQCNYTNKYQLNLKVLELYKYKNTLFYCNGCEEQCSISSGLQIHENKNLCNNCYGNVKEK